MAIETISLPRCGRPASPKPVFHQQLIKEEDLTGIIAANHIIYFPIHYHLLPYLEIFDADQV
jgi:hypothetical protein